jgi:hypothetical protein
MTTRDLTPRGLPYGTNAPTEAALRAADVPLSPIPVVPATPPPPPTASPPLSGDPLFEIPPISPAAVAPALDARTQLQTILTRSPNPFMQLMAQRLLDDV